MPTIIEKTVYTFEELSDKAKERARDWWRTSSSYDNFYAEHVFEDAATIAALMGIDLCQTRKTRQDGSHFYEPTIYYSGFSSQGDGACFECSYKYKKGAPKAVKAYAPEDKELLRIAKALQEAQRKQFYKLTASGKHRGHYYHSGCMIVDVEHSEDRYRDIGDSEDTITECLRDFADWIYKQLEKAYDWENSDENVDESIRANEYQFDEDGEII